MQDSLTATYTRTRWASPDGRASVGVVTLDDGTASTVVGSPTPALVAGQRYRFAGSWVTHETHGRQFRFALAVRDVGVHRGGVLAYLTRLDGIGEARASTLWDAFGPEAVAALRDRPASVATAKLLPAEVAFAASRVLQKEQVREAVTLELYSLLAKRGFQIAKVVEEALRLWGQRAAERVRRNPYALLLAEVTSCSWARCDALYLSLGGKSDAMRRQALAGVSWVQSQGGDTWHPAGHVAQAIRALCGIESDPVRGIMLAARLRLLEVWRRGGERFVALKEEAKNEATVARRLRLLSCGAENGRATA